MMSSTNNNSFALSASLSIADMFEPDVMLPSQYLNVSSPGLSGGERRLMAALLSDGVEAYIHQCTAHVSSETNSVDAKEWVENEDASYVFSFDFVCECLGINAKYLRMGLRRYVEAVNLSRLTAEGDKGQVWKKIRRPRKRL